MVHFPVALWTVASGIVFFRAFSDGPLARAFDRVLVPLLLIGVATGVVSYTLGLLVWPPDTLQATPLGRNHMIAASWSLSSWVAVLFLRWRVGEMVWEGRVNRLIMVGLGALGASQLAATGTLGGHLHGGPAYLSELMRVFGWDVYHTFYTPTWVLLVLAVVIVVMPVLAIVTTRGRAARVAARGSRPVKRVGLVSAIVILAIGLAGPARAVPPGFTLEFDGNGEGKVTFSGNAHSRRAKPHCADCHFELFDVSRSSQITRADHKRQQFCFACHDGEQAFAAKQNCDRCHVEPEVPRGAATGTSTGTAGTMTRDPASGTSNVHAIWYRYAT